MAPDIFSGDKREVDLPAVKCLQETGRISEVLFFFFFFFFFSNQNENKAKIDRIPVGNAPIS